MRINKLILNGYNYLKFSGIENLSIDTDSVVQVIIGDNGSGKSKLMAMFAAKPPQSTLFSKNGSMELHIEHNDKEYIMSYDSATKKHSFIDVSQGNVELNDSGTSGVSEELAETHLNYNKIIDKLIFNKMRMTQMASAARMEFLTSINPINIRFMKDKYVKIVSQIKKMKSQLELLQKRTAEYKASMMDVEAYENFISELEQLKNFDNSIIQLMYRYETLLSTIDTFDPKFDRDYYRHALRKLTRFRLSLNPAPSEISYNDINDLINQRDTNTFKLNEHINQLETISREINELEIVLSKSDNTPLSQLEQLYSQYQESLNKFPDFTSELILDWPPKDPEDIAFKYLHQLSEVSQEVAERYINKIWNVKKYTFHKERYKRIMLQRDDLNRQLNQLCIKYTDLQRHADNSTRIGPDNNCIITTCSLKNRYQEIVKSENLKVMECKKEIDYLTKMQSKYSRILQIYHTLLPYQDLFLGLTGIVPIMLNTIKNISPSLLTLFDRGIDSIINGLNKNNQYVVNTVRHSLKMSTDYNEMIHLKNKLKELELSIQARKKDVSTEFAKKKIADNYKKVNELDKIINDIRHQLIYIQTSIDYENKVANGISRTAKIIEDIDYDIIAYEGQAKQIAYSSIRQQLSELHQHISSYIRDVETVVDKQKRIRQLYIVEYTTIQQLEQQVKELSVMEQALNPYTGLPSKYTKAYLDQILQNVNYIISQVFTYKLEVSLIDEGDTKYRFNVMVHDVPAGDISNCSDGQMEIIDFAFTISLMIALGIHKTHPLFLDEIGRCQDTTHAQKLLETIIHLTTQGYIHQLFIINHQAVLLGGFDNADVICLRSENIMLPEEYNKKVKIN